MRLLEWQANTRMYRPSKEESSLVGQWEATPLDNKLESARSHVDKAPGLGVVPLILGGHIFTTLIIEIDVYIPVNGNGKSSILKMKRQPVWSSFFLCTAQPFGLKA
jgi:hypothetical protein